MNTPMTNEKILSIFKSYGDCTKDGIVEFAKVLLAEKDTEKDKKITELEDLLDAALSLIERTSCSQPD